MSKIFHTYINKYQFLTPERLYGEFVEYFETEFTKNDSTIYFIAKCKKPSWIQGSIKFIRDYKFSAKIKIDNSVHDVVIDMAEFWHAMPEMKKHFDDKRTMADYFMARSNSFPWRLLPMDMRYRFLSSVNSIADEGKKLTINCEIAKNANRERKSLTDVFLYQAINHYNLPEPKLDIIYIGSSLKSTFARLKKHEKWGWIQAQKGSDEDILVFFTEIEGDEFQVSGPIISRNDHGLSRKDETLITEMALINYFKPKEYNDKHVDREIKHSERVKEKLVGRGYTQVCVEMLLEGNIAKLGSVHKPEYGEHTIYHDIA
ncbi:hypothetical protein [Aeromonas schubertii]|uniref:hypothetical protein n=1 Tax=Aeromonas schubertii TaxID=652 RepID=UPI001CC5A90A|nr:hypothetical protein [Aeromonas schubertii]MBZ6074666.1 hypothetical protein [Aeromonas schubertii]